MLKEVHSHPAHRSAQPPQPAVKRVLVEMGVPAENIETVGVGINHPEHVPDVDNDGTLLPGTAAKNGAVFVTVIT